MQQVSIPEEADISRRQWKLAWNPVELLVRYFVVSIVLAGVLLIPLAWAVGMYSLSVVTFPILGIVLSTVVWRRSCKAVNTVYQGVLDDITDWNSCADDEVQVWATNLTGSGEQYCLEPAQEYTITYVMLADAYTTIEEVTVDIANLETSTNSVQIPSQQITSQSFDKGTFRLKSARGIWNVEGLKSQ